jgi:hypothetical protein
LISKVVIAGLDPASHQDKSGGPMARRFCWIMIRPPLIAVLTAVVHHVHLSRGKLIAE